MFKNFIKGLIKIIIRKISYNQRKLRFVRKYLKSLVRK